MRWEQFGVNRDIQTHGPNAALPLCLWVRPAWDAIAWPAVKQGFQPLLPPHVSFFERAIRDREIGLVGGSHLINLSHVDATVKLLRAISVLQGTTAKHGSTSPNRRNGKWKTETTLTGEVGSKRSALKLGGFNKEPTDNTKACKHILTGFNLARHQKADSHVVRLQAT